MTAAVFGLIGVVVGALVSGGVQFWFRRADARDRRRVGLRMVVNEVSRVTEALDVAVEFNSWPNDDSLRMVSIIEYRPELAGVLSDREWDELTKVPEIIGIVDAQRRQAVEAALAANLLRLPAPSEDQHKIIAFCHGGLTHALTVLKERSSGATPETADKGTMGQDDAPSKSIA